MTLQLLLILLMVSAAHADFVLQAGPFTDKQSAQEQAEKFEVQGLTASVHVEQKGDAEKILVRIGPFKTEAEALEKKARLREERYTGEIALIDTEARFSDEPVQPESIKDAATGQEAGPCYHWLSFLKSSNTMHLGSRVCSHPKLWCSFNGT